MTTMPPDPVVPACCRRRPRRPGLGNAIGAYRPLLAQWLLQLALDLEWYRKPGPGRLADAIVSKEFLAITGVCLDVPLDDDGELLPKGRHAEAWSEAQLADLLEARLAALPTDAPGEGLPLLANVALLAELLGLEIAEQEIVAFVAAMQGFPAFRQAISRSHEEVDTPRLAAIAARLADLPEIQAVEALREDRPLQSTGILQLDSGHVSLEDKAWLRHGLAETLLVSDLDQARLVARLMKPAEPAGLALEAFRHLERDVEVVVAYLREVVRGSEAGANLLFHGQPGTGKTELAKAVAQAAGLCLFEVPLAQDNGRPLAGEARWRAYRLCQALASRITSCVLLFDEVEDAFATGVGDSRGPGGKAWINRTLERNPVPAIWITNDVDIDPAYLRRFDYSVHFAVPPQEARLEMARHHFQAFAPTDAWLYAIANHDQVTAAQLERAARLARLAGDATADACRLVEQALDRSTRLLGQRRLSAAAGEHAEYDLGVVNADADLRGLIDGVRRRPRGSFCFYGPPGTGKSALGRHLARCIGRPALVRRASDLLSKWLGETERNIADMFADAADHDAVLILDEADSFLADRRDALRSWEVTQVNELLTQMEAHEGVFVCTTNLMERLDPASLRRFVFKVKFDYLTAAQRWQLFCSELGRLGGELGAARALEGQVRALECLTPGDFAVASRRLQLLGEAPTALGLLAHLRAECAVKGTPAGRMGFQA